MVRFKAKQIRRTYIQRIMTRPFLAFRLLCPVRQREWIDGWEYEMIFSQSGLAEEGCVFKTQNSIGSETIWTITKQDEEKLQIEFLLVTPDIGIEKIQFNLRDNQDDTTNAHILYMFTALTESGNIFIENHREGFILCIGFLEEPLNYFLMTGQTLKGQRLYMYHLENSITIGAL